MERDPEIQQVIDELKIRNLLDKYPRALDRQDHELLASLFHPGAKDEHGVYNGSAAGYVDFMAAQGKPGLHWMHHNGTQITVGCHKYSTMVCAKAPPNCTLL